MDLFRLRKMGLGFLATICYVLLQLDVCSCRFASTMIDDFPVIKLSLSISAPYGPNPTTPLKPHPLLTPLHSFLTLPSSSPDSPASQAPTDSAPHLQPDSDSHPHPANLHLGPCYGAAYH